MGLVYLPTWMVDVYGFHVAKYKFIPYTCMQWHWVRHRPHKNFYFQGAKAESGILKVDTKKDLGAANQASAWTQRGEQKSSDFFFPNPPANPKRWRIFGNDDLICGTFGIWFLRFNFKGV